MIAAMLRSQFGPTDVDEDQQIVKLQVTRVPWMLCKVIAQVMFNQASMKEEL